MVFRFITLIVTLGCVSSGQRSESTLGDRFASVVKQLELEPECRNAFHAFAVLDSNVVYFLSTVDRKLLDSEFDLNRAYRVRFWGRQSPWRASVRFVRLEETGDEALYLAVTYSILVVNAPTRGFSSLRIIGRTNEHPAFRVFDTSDRHIDFLETPMIEEPAFRPCSMRPDVQYKTRENGTHLLHGYYVLPTGWGVGGIEWRWDPARQRLDPIKNNIFCKNFVCEKQK